jgi:hypothetical protein
VERLAVCLRTNTAREILLIVFWSVLELESFGVNEFFGVDIFVILMDRNWALLDK